MADNTLRVIVFVMVGIFISMGIVWYLKFIGSAMKRNAVVIKRSDDSRFTTLAMVQFLDDIQNEKPIRFTSQQLRMATDDFTIELGSGGYGKVYKGIISKNKFVAVKVLNGTPDDQKIEDQFMAEVSTIGRTHHVNLVRLYGFCFESGLVALVYEFMVNGSLDNHLGNKGEKIGFEKLHEIAVGTARGIAYLHEDCAHRIVHYDIKPGNILLDSNFCAKVADFGLAKLFNKDITHISLTRVRGTPGYTAPEIWMLHPVTHKSDVYSFGMLLFKIIGRRKDMDVINEDIQQWFPLWAWGKYEKNELKDLMTECEIEAKDYQGVERILKVALCCVQSRAENRPEMSIIVKMLEGVVVVPEPLNPFTHLTSSDQTMNNQTAINISGSDWSSSDVVTNSGEVAETLMKKYEIKRASE